MFYVWRICLLPIAAIMQWCALLVNRLLCSLSTWHFLSSVRHLGLPYSFSPSLPPPTTHIPLNCSLLILPLQAQQGIDLRVAHGLHSCMDFSGDDILTPSASGGQGAKVSKARAKGKMGKWSAKARAVMTNAKPATKIKDKTRTTETVKTVKTTATIKTMTKVKGKQQPRQQQQQGSGKAAVQWPRSLVDPVENESCLDKKYKYKDGAWHVNKVVINENNMREARNPKPVRLGTDFSGMESVATALSDAGIPFRHMFACEKHPPCLKHILYNHSAETVQIDICRRSYLETPGVNLYVAGFPCQPFSTAGLGQGKEAP